MFSHLATSGTNSVDAPSRRDFLKASAVGAGVLSLGVTNLGAVSSSGRRDINCILLFLVGGPSQLETFDPKPDAPSHIRGPFGTIPTTVPGIRLSDQLPRTAQLVDQFAIVRSVYSSAAPIHENGQQLMQTGRLCRDGNEHPHFGSVCSRLKGQRASGTPAFAVLPWDIGNTGVSIGHGQCAGGIGKSYEPLQASLEFARQAARIPNDLSVQTKRAFNLECENDALRTRYGRHHFGESCLTARRFVEGGVRVVTVNMFDTVFAKTTWDCHADGGSLATTLGDYRDTLCPMFDCAYSALLEDLRERGMLDTTLVLAMGEFGRTPKLNPRGGRDHWTGCWSVLFAGAGIRGGRVVGSSDAIAAEPKDRPVTPAEIVATVYAALGLDPRTRLAMPSGQTFPLADADPICELLS